MYTPDKYEHLGAFYLGRSRENPEVPLLYDSRDLTTHAICVGMTGSGKTGLCIALLEEALIDGIPAIVIDPKGDISNLLLTFPELRAEDFAPWVEDGDPAHEAQRWRDGLAGWGQGTDRIRRLRSAGEVAVYTPGSSAGRMVSILGSLAAPPAQTRAHAEAFAERIESTVTSLLALLGIEGDPLQSSEHVYLSNVLQHFWESGRDLDLATLIQTIGSPPFTKIGVLDVDTVFGPRDRGALAMRLNNLLAAPSFAPWLEGDSLDVDAFLRTPGGKPRISIFSIAHLGSSERMFFVSLLLGRLVDWMRQQPGTSSLRALAYMDEIHGYLPPVANPPSKTPMLTLLKQARAYGLGVVLATQNPVDVDYKALSNAGTWFLGRLQTEQDVARVVDGLLAADPAAGLERGEVGAVVQGLKKREFLLHNAHAGAPQVFETRWVMSYLRGPLTKEDLRRLTADPAGEATPTPALARPPIADDAIAGGKYLAPKVPGGASEELVWRPMYYGAGSAHVRDARKRIDEVVRFGWIRGLRGGAAAFAWDDAAAVELPLADLRDEGPPGRHLEVDPTVTTEALCAEWRERLAEHAVRNVRAFAWSCPALRMQSETGESEAHFRGRVELAIREKRDQAVDKVRQQYQRKVERLEGQLQRAREQLGRQQDQARDAQLSAAVNVGEALLGMFGGRRRRVSSHQATRVVREQRDVGRAEEKVEGLVSDLYDLEAEMEAALIDVAAEHGSERYPVETVEAAPSAREVKIDFCGLVWVPYWFGPGDSRRRAA